MRRSALTLAAALALTACGSAGEVRLDIESIAPAMSPMLPPELSGPTHVPFDVVVLTRDLAPVLDARGAPDLRIVSCAAPDGDGETLPVYFGGEPLVGTLASQLGGDPETRVQLTVAVPREAAGRPGRCLRFIGREGLMRPSVTGRPVPIPTVPDQAAV